jgi:hypothetical protein
VTKGGIKGTDVLSPTWVLGSIERGYLLPKTKRFVGFADPSRSMDQWSSTTHCSSRFYVRATEATRASKEYNGEEDANGAFAIEEDGKSEDSDVKMEDDNISRASASATGASPAAMRDPYEEEEEDDDSSADGDGDGPQDASDWNDDDDEEEEDNKPSTSSLQPVDQHQVDEMGLSGAKPGMGAGLGAVEFDEAKPFAPYVCYFDTAENAVVNNLPASKSSKTLQEAGTKK